VENRIIISVGKKLKKMDNKKKLSEITKVPYYGENFPFIPWTLIAKFKVELIFAKNLYKKLGFLSFLWFCLMLPFRLVPNFKKNRDGIRLMGKSFGWMAKTEWALLLVIYRQFEKKYGKFDAYLFAKNSIQECSSFMMNDFYQADRLKDFEDPFEAFWLFHKAMFKDDPNYPNEFIEEKDCKIMVVHSCRNCKIAKMTIPELAPIGCDHDITGYRAIGNKTQMEFRRPQTLAKDGLPCRFMFFRKGTAPENIETK
jgi:hypothetical protein